MSYFDLTALAKKMFVGKTLEDKHARKITFDDIAIGSKGSTLYVKLAFHTSVLCVAGWVYLTGTPHYQDSTGMLTFDGFDFDPHTNSVIIQVANWLLHDEFVDYIQKHLVFDLSSKTAAIHRTLDSKITDLLISNSPVYKVWLDASPSTPLQIADFHIGTDAISLSATWAGSMELQVGETSPVHR